MPLKKLLFLTPQLPYPPHQGTAIRNYNLIKELSARYEVHLLSLAEDPSAEDIDHLRQLCRSVQTVPAPRRTLAQRALSTLTSKLPDMGLRLESPAFHNHLIALLAATDFDVVQVEGIEMAPYIQDVLARNPRPLVVLDDHNAEYVLQRRAFETDIRQPARWLAAAYSLIQWRKLRRYEREACLRAHRVVAVSEADAEALAALLGDREIAVVPNGVDAVYWQPPEVFVPLPRAPAVVFTGKMDFRPNVDAMLWFHSQVFPLIQQRAGMPVHLYVVGKDPHPRLAPLVADPHVALTGYVPDVRPYTSGADVYIVPLRIGGGTRLKVLEAMAMGKALVSTTLGCEGINLTHGREALLADSPSDFADAVVSLLRDETRCRELGQRAREYATSLYDWRRIAPLLEKVYDRS